jgi:AmmeMemoRadiSam system protein A
MFKLFERTSEKPPQDALAHPPASELAPDQRRTLLWIAHEAILSVLERRTFSVEDGPPAAAELSEPRGVFTTLYLRGEPSAELLPLLQLRGCVGYVVPVAPLYRAVAQTARAAAFEDSRFPPVTIDEALRLKISLSVLSRLFSIRPEAVEVGRHGLLISDGPRRGLLLPQVPVEHGWDRQAFLEQTCRKAGLPLNAWRATATIDAFTAEVFGDDDADIESSR